LLRPSTFIKDVPSCSESILHIIMADTDTRLPGRVLVARGRHLELSTPPEFFRASTRAPIGDAAQSRRCRHDVGCAQITKSSQVYPSVWDDAHANDSG
jgi:hypothetical protein